MCCAMDPELQSGGSKLRRKLGAAVQSLQWSYAIFWSLSSEGELEWGDGFYNGDIKTRKTTLPMELSVEQMGLERSRQLRDLYESLSESNQHTKRPSAALSPEDLTDAEWFYMVCMSFVFSSGQGYDSFSLQHLLQPLLQAASTGIKLPGRAFAEGRHIWLCDAPYADSIEFTRSLLAKSAGIETVVCFPRADGVLEFGVNELVAEDSSFVQHILTFFLEVCKPACSEQSTFSPRKSGGHDDDDDDGIKQTFKNLDSERIVILSEKTDYVAPCNQFSKDHRLKPCIHSFILKEETNLDMRVDNVSHAAIQKVVSPGHSSNENHPHPVGDSFMLDEMTDTYQVQDWLHVDKEISEGAHGSINSSDCISQSYANKEKTTVVYNEKLDQFMQELKECTLKRLKPDASENDTCHYSRTLSAILCDSHGPKTLGNSYDFSINPSSGIGNKSVFSRWRQGANFEMQLVDTPQKLLKKALFDVGLLHQNHSFIQENVESKVGGGKHAYAAAGDHIFSEQRGKLNEQFYVLRSLVPSMNKLDNASLLGDTIQYLQELERRVEELESFKETVGRKRFPDVTERTSDNYAGNGCIDSKKTRTIEHRDSSHTEPKSELQWVLCKDGTTDVMVMVNEEEVVVDIQCPWRECLLLEILKSLKAFHFDVQSVESSTSSNIIKLSVKAKVRKAKFAATEEIKHALQKIVSKC